MRILVIGGTGTMGKPLVDLLRKDNSVFVACRNKTGEIEGVSFFYGDANDLSFLKSLLNCHYDSIVDFCWCSSIQFKKKYRFLLDATDQYICLSSAAVVADGVIPLRENSERFLDLCHPREDSCDYYDYQYEKARIEDLLINSGKRNWTIIRPHITYSENHIVWGEYNEEQFLLRAVLGKKVIAPQDMLRNLSSVTFSGDVAIMIKMLIGNTKALGQVVNVSNPVGLSWGQMLDEIKQIIEEMGYPMKIYYIKNSLPLQRAFPSLSSRYTNDRLLDRVFSNDKFKEITEATICFVEFKKQMRCCIELWLNKQKDNYKVMDGHSFAMLDRISREWTPLSSFSSFKEKCYYVIYRMPLLSCFYVFFEGAIKKIKHILFVLWNL